MPVLSWTRLRYLCCCYGLFSPGEKESLLSGSIRELLKRGRSPHSPRIASQDEKPWFAFSKLHLFSGANKVEVGAEDVAAHETINTPHASKYWGLASSKPWNCFTATYLTTTGRFYGLWSDKLVLVNSWTRVLISSQHSPVCCRRFVSVHMCVVHKMMCVFVCVRACAWRRWPEHE
jgi:hypothetical protein